MQTLLDIFQNTKDILCKYDYYIYTSKRIIHLTNSELKIPHLMGMQYIGRPNQFTGDFGVYSIKKKRITLESIEKLVKKYYKKEEKQRVILEMIYRKLNNLYLLEEMFHSYSKLYLDNKGVYHCNSFMTTYQSDREKDIFFCNLSHRYEINKIVQEDKQSKEKEVIYLSEQAELREIDGITKMLISADMETDDKLIKYILRLNVRFGKYHTLDMLTDTEQLWMECRNKRDKALVKHFIALWNKQTEKK